MSNKLKEDNKDQYKSGGDTPHIKAKDAHDVRDDALDSKITLLNDRVNSQYKVIDKLVRDVKRLKDQVSELAGKIPRG